MLPIDPLTRLAIRHGTDKWGGHFYTPVYEELFRHRRDEPVRLLEIGVGGYGYRRAGGASLAMWAEYFAFGEIVGVDIHRKMLDLGPRVKVLQGSQNDPAFLRVLGAEHGPFDIIIDDGSHIPNDVVVSFLGLFPALREGGLYVVEDVQTAFWPTFGGDPRTGAGTMQLASAILLGLNHTEIAVADPSQKVLATAREIRSLRAYHNLLVIEKGDNTEPSNHGFDADNPHAMNARAMIEAEMSRAPTAGGRAQLALLHELAGRLDLALQEIEAALVSWPHDMMLLTNGIRVAKQAQDLARLRAFVAAARTVSPEDFPEGT